MLSTETIKAVKQQYQVPLDIHVMAERPEHVLPWLPMGEGDVVSIHYESTPHVDRVLQQIAETGATPALALNPATPLSMIEEVLCDVDGVLLMTVNPGFAGQKLVPQTVNKNARLRKMLDENGYGHVRIEVDGNVSFENLEKLRTAGPRHPLYSRR